MGLNSVLPLEGAGSAIKNLFAGSQRLPEGELGSEESAKSGFLALLQKIIPDDPDGLAPDGIPAEGGLLDGTNLGSDGRLAAFAGPSGLTSPQAENRTNAGFAQPTLSGALSGALKIPAGAASPFDVAPQIAPPLDGALPIAGDISENGARLYGRAGQAFERYLANSSGSGETQTLVGDTRVARPAAPSFNLALPVTGKTEGALSIPSDVINAAGNAKAMASVKADVAVAPPAQSVSSQSFPGAAPAGQASLAQPALAQTVVVPSQLNSPAGGAAQSGQALPEPTLFGPAVSGPQPGRSQPAGGAAATAGLPATLPGQASVQAARVNGPIQPAESVPGAVLSEGVEGEGEFRIVQPTRRTGVATPAASGSGLSGESVGSSQASLRNAVSPAAQKFAATLGIATPQAVSAASPETVGAGLPADGVAKVDNGFATLTPQNTTEAGTARSLSPAIASAAAGIARGAAQGENRFTIRLDPPELGRVDVRMKIGDDGIARAHLIVERPETLDLFLRDQRALERSLEQAGVKTDSNSLQFSLEDGDQGAAFARSDDEGSSANGGRNEDGRSAGDAAAGTDPSVAAIRTHDGQLNITI